MKFFLILWVCSAIHGSCIVPPITVPGEYNSHTECVSAGYKEGYNVFIAIDKTLASLPSLFKVLFIVRTEFMLAVLVYFLPIAANAI